MGSEADRNVDIGTWMVNYQHVSDKLYIFKLAVEGVKKTRRWENYPLSAVVVSTICVSVLIPRLLLLLGAVCLVFLIMAGSKHITKSKHRKTSSLQPLHSKLIDEDKEHLKATASAQATRQQQLEAFRKLLKTSNDILININTLQDQIISLLTWKNERNTLSLLMFLLIWIVAAMWVTIPMVVSVILVIFFCWNKYFFNQSLSFWKGRIWFLPLGKKHVNQSQYNPERLQHGRRQYVFTSSHDNTHEEEEMSNSCERTMEEHNSDSASQTDIDLCHKCKASFSILKRKHSCSNCGYVFCGSCSVKVTRATLGATSPAAFEQHVRICYDCKSLLDKKDEKDESQTPSDNLSHN